MQKSAKNKEKYNFINIYCDADHVRDISARRSVTYTVNIFNVTIIEWCANKQSETSIIRSNAETRAVYTGVFYQNWIRDFFRAICYPIGTPSKKYEDKQATIKIVMVDRITTQARTLDLPITALHELHLSFS